MDREYSSVSSNTVIFFFFFPRNLISQSPIESCVEINLKANYSPY